MAAMSREHRRLRVGRTLGRTLYLVAPGDDRMADTCIGMVDTPELAEWIVSAVNATAEVTAYPIGDQVNDPADVSIVRRQP